MLLVEEQITEALQGQLDMTGFVKTPKSTAFSAKWLRVIIKGRQGFEIVFCGVLGDCPIIFIDESKLTARVRYDSLQAFLCWITLTSFSA